MIDITEFQSQQNSIDLKQFIDTCIKSVENGKDLLAKKWFVEVQNIFYQGNKRKLVPNSSEPFKQKSFFDCVACLMTSNLQSLTLNSLNDYENIFVSPRTSIRMYEHPGKEIIIHEAL